MNRLNRKYSDFLLDYYDKIEKIEKMEEKIITNLSNEYIYNNFSHIHSFYIELKTYNSIFNQIFKYHDDRNDDIDGGGLNLLNPLIIFLVMEIVSFVLVFVVL